MENQVDFRRVEVWKTTNQLRWKKVYEDIDELTCREILELQQKFISDSGVEKWEAVEVVE